MPKKQLVVVEGYVLGGGGDSGAHPEHPIYIPITPPPDSGLSPEHPIYIPLPDPGYGVDEGAHPDHTLPGDLPHPDQGLPQPEQPVDPGYGVPEGAHPEHPIFLPIPAPPDLGIWGPDDPRPTPPIYIPIDPPTGGEVPPEIDNGLPDLSDEQKQKLVEFLTGNLPPFDGPNVPTPV